MTEQEIVPTPSSRFRVYTVEELRTLHNSGVLVDGVFVSKIYSPDLDLFQETEEVDNPENGIKIYRDDEKKQLLSFLDGNRVVFLIGPSRSYKTEAVLSGSNELPFPRGDTLAGIPDTVYIDLKTIHDYYNFQVEVESSGVSQPSAILIDEYDLEHQSILIEFMQNYPDIKIVITIGGIQSNQYKIENFLLPLQNELNIEIPYVEMGLKPLNDLQALEMINFYKNRNMLASSLDGQEVLSFIQEHGLILVPFSVRITANILSREDLSEEDKIKECLKQLKGSYCGSLVSVDEVLETN
ncbi:hypothetical protein KC675_05630 [Candidatus Dojkabacteria bacterium]|uniref:Uncharacterized protein n=1 Tax=Candidatus Dojkabacteria bacterium TaxID=2099670 RepID=A0A955L0V9_9BACT|nr:hypothetical protein [Candidatus Dojkabacteria bacterium]